MDEFTNEEFNAMALEMENLKKNSTFQSMYWKPEKEGVTKIRILTPLKQFGEKLFFQAHKIHYLNGRSYFCLNQRLEDKNGVMHEPEECPACKKAKQLYSVSQRGTEEWTLAGSIAAKDRYVSRIIVRGKKTSDDQDDEATPEFWEFGKKAYEQFFNYIRMGEYGNFLSLKEGRDYNLSKKGTGRQTSYDGSTLSPNVTPVFTDALKIKKLLAAFPDMKYSKLVEFKSSEEIRDAVELTLNPNAEIEAETAPAAAYSAPAPEQDNLDPFAASPTNSASVPEQDIDALLSMV